MGKDDDRLPKKSGSSMDVGSRGVSSSMRRLMRMTRAVGVLFGGTVTLVGLMSVVGVVTDVYWLRLVVALVVGVGIPAFVTDRLLKRTGIRGGLTMVADVFAIVLLGAALVLVSVDVVSKPLLVREGDRYAMTGSRAMARFVYFLGGVTPVFPDTKSPAPTGSSGASSTAPAPGLDGGGAKHP